MAARYGLALKRPDLQCRAERGPTRPLEPSDAMKVRRAAPQPATAWLERPAAATLRPRLPAVSLQQRGERRVRVGVGQPVERLDGGVDLR